MVTLDMLRSLYNPVGHPLPSLVVLQQAMNGLLYHPSAMSSKHKEQEQHKPRVDSEKLYDLYVLHS